MSQYDYLVVGAGITGAIFAHEARRAGKTCLVIDRRDHVAGNIYTKEVDGLTCTCTARTSSTPPCATRGIT